MSLKENVIASVAAAVVGAVVTAVLGAVTIVIPIRSDVVDLKHENEKLAKMVDRFQYGEVIESAGFGDLVFHYNSSEIDQYHNLKVRILIDNNSDIDLEGFTLHTSKAGVQTDQLEVFNVNQVKIYNSDISEKNYLNWTIPAGAKHLPVELTVKNYKSDASNLSMITFPVSLSRHGTQKTIVLTDAYVERVSVK